MIEVTEQVPQNLDGEAHPFYFRASPQDNLPAPSAIAMIRADEVGRLRLFADWGDWNDAIDL